MEKPRHEIPNMKKNANYNISYNAFLKHFIFDSFIELKNNVKSHFFLMET